ncbi:MAG: carboxypeptidase-like regulatory domain-containing protein, partial [Planctomycetota bacterium]|nr:carboxypeptidase-like regulatory domain-containing protein [Planctomycetota bacterium]
MHDGPGSWVEVIVDHPDFVRQQDWIVRQTTEQDLILRRGARFAVVVLAPDKSPVAGAKVSVEAPSLFSGTTVFGDGRTDKDGRVVVGTVPATVVNVAVVHADYATRRETVRIESDAPFEHVVVVDTGGAVAGRVFDPKGEPVEGAVVHGGSLAATTAADGTYRLERVPVGTVRVVATKDGFGAGFFGEKLGWAEPVPLTVRAGALTAGIDIHLGKATWVIGRVVDDNGAPVAEAGVNLWHRTGFAHKAHTTTDAKGAFRVGPLSLTAPAEVTVLINATGFTVQNPKKRTAKPGEDVDFGRITAARLGEIRGRVIGADGKPVQALVNVVSMWAPPVRTDADGNFVCRGLLGKVILTAETSLPNIEKSRRFERDIAVGEIVEGVELHLFATGTIRGRVVNQAGGVPHWMTVTAMQGKTAAASVGTRTDGRFSFEHLPVGEYRIGLNDPEGEGLLADPAPVVVKTGTTDLEFVVTTPGGAVIGKVFGHDGRPLPDFMVTLIRFKMLLPRQSSMIGFTGGGSEFVMTVDEPGTYAIDLSASGVASHRTPKFSIAAGETKDLGTIKLGAGGRIKGTVRNAAGRPVPYTRINILNAKLQTNDDAPFTDEEGRYEVSAVSPGLYTVFALTPDHPLGMVRAVRVREAKAAEVDITLLAPAPLTVAVTDRGGNPIPGAELSFTFKAIAPLTSKLFRREIPPGAGSPVADEAGLIHQHVLPPGEVMITIEAKGFRQ